MRKWGLRLGIVLSIVVLLIVLKATVLRPDPVPVRVVEVATGLVEETVTNSRAGTVKARRRATLSPEIGGQVVALPFREGERVHQGDVLLRLEDSSQQARLELAERELATSRAERRRVCHAAERAAQELERTSRLAAEGIVSPSI